MTLQTREIVLTFHGIGTPPITIPVDEVRYWVHQSQFENIVSSLAQAALDHDIDLTITFDDGNKSDVRIAAPFLKQLKVRGIFFPCSGRLDKAGYLNREDLLELISEGFEIGSHGAEHLPWASLDDKALMQEIFLSKKELEDVTGRPVRAAALPFGSYNRRTLAAVRSAGYRKVYSSDPGLTSSERWFNRRFSFHKGVTFDLPAIIAEYSHPARIIVGSAKHFIKAIR